MNIALSLSVLLAAAVGVSARTYETIEGRPCFRSMTGMMDSMFYLAEDHPELLTISDIGDSWLKNNEGRHDGKHEVPDGGYDIYALKVTASDSKARRSEDKGKMLVTSGVHAREWAPPELLARFLESLVHGYNVDADVTSILQTTEIHAILYVNPDARFMAERYPDLYWRKNMHPIRCGGGYEYGVDINRNFNFMFGDQNGASNDPCADDYHGPRPESEPETKAMAEYARRLFPEAQRKRDPVAQRNEPFGEDVTGMYVDIHASGGYVYYPWGHKDAKSPDDEALQALGRKINSFNGYKLWAGSQPDYLYPASGDTSDWAYAELGVASLGFEIGDDFFQECESFEADVVPKNLPALLFAAKTVEIISKTELSTMKSAALVTVAIVAASSSEQACAFSGSFAGARVQTQAQNAGANSLTMEYIPSGMSKEQWRKLKDAEKNKNKGKNLGQTGITSFKSRSFADWQKSGGKNLFPVDPKSVKDPKDLPYMQRPGGSADDSDVKKGGGGGMFGMFGGAKKAKEPAAKAKPEPEKKTNWWNLK